MLNIGERVLFGVLFFGVFFIINLSFAFAEDTVDDTLNITVPISCSLSATGTNSHTATIIPGTYSGASGSEYENGIGLSTLTTFCNDAGGYAIYAIGYTNNEYGNNTLEGTNTSSIINTKVYASGDTASNWSMRVNKVTDTSESYLPNNLTITNSFDSWHTVPDDYIKVANYTVNTDIGTNAKGSKITTTYASFIASAQLADTYSGQVLYTLVHPNDAATPMKPINYTINYNANAGADTVGNLPSTQTGTTSDATITLSTMEPTRDDYIFDSWCTTNTSETSCSGASYSSGDALPTNLLSNPNHTITLYAVWEDNSTHTFDPETSGVTIDDSPEGVEIQNNILEEMYMAQSPEIYFDVENEIAAILGEPEYDVNELWSFIVPNLDQIGFRYGIDELKFTECLSTPYAIGAPLAIVIVQVDEDGEITSTHVVEGVVDSMGCADFTTTLYQNKNTGVYAVFNKW